MFFRDNVVLFIALIGSVALHVLIIPSVYVIQPSMAHLPSPKATHLETPPIEDKSITLGLDSSKNATLTWIGYEDYEEQRARFAEFEQAEMKAVTLISPPAPTPTAIDLAKQLTNPLAEMASDFLDALRGLEITLPSRDVQVSITEQEATQPPDQSQEPSNPVSEVVEDAPAEGAPSDRDSSATSTIKISPEQWKSGKPLAAQGIVLRPRRPSFTANQLVTNAPSDLVAELHINNKGKPTDVVVIFSTGSNSVDGSLVSSLYRWRASGDQIDTLGDDETIVISIHITFAK